jgi:flagella basal body P-ring formation protein FlgA
MHRPASILACWLGGAITLLAATVEVRLRPEVVLAAPRATLADLAELSGPPDAVAAVAALPMQELSPVAVRVDERLVRARIGRQAATVTLRISGEAAVRQPLQVVTVAQLQAAAEGLLRTAGDDAEIVLVRASGQVSFGDDGTVPELRAEPLDRGTVGEVAIRIKVLRGDRELARSLVVLRVRRFAQVVTLGVDLHHGQPVGAGDVGLQRIELTPATQEAFRSLDEAVGRVVMRDLTAGQVLTPGVAQAAADVRPGQAVTLVFRSGTVELSAPGEALSDGHVGEIVTVRRLADDRRMRTQILGPGRVLVNF